MDALLKWSMRQQGEDPSGPSPTALAEDIKAGKRPDLDPAVLEAMMGKSEATMMQEELKAALDPQRSQKDREVALDNFEMLIESIDNANMITSMKMWSPLLSLLSSPSVSPSLQVATLWILGTACQNNPSAQDALLNAHATSQGEGGAPALDIILALLTESQDMAVRAKAMYALSALLGHHPRAVQAFGEKDGYQVLKTALRDPSINIRRKTAFLVNSLLLQDDSVEQIQAAQPLLLGAPPSITSPPAPTSSSLSQAATTTTTSSSSSSVAAPLRATGITLPTGSTPEHRPVSNAAPMEKPPVTSTAASGVIHPNVCAALVSSNLLVPLAYSLLPSNVTTASSGDSGSSSGVGTSSNDHDNAENSTTSSEIYDPDVHLPDLGLDGDAQEARSDEDYAEKALRALCTFVVKYEESTTALNGSSSSLSSSASSRLPVLGAVAKRGLREVSREMDLGGQRRHAKGNEEEEEEEEEVEVNLWDWKKLNMEESDWREFQKGVERIARQ